MAAKLLQVELPGRAHEIDTMWALMGEGGAAPPAMFVYGSPATGKTAVVRAVLEASSKRQAYASCTEVHSPRVLFEGLLNTLKGEHPDSSTGYGSPARCDSMHAFILQLDQLLTAAAGDAAAEGVGGGAAGATAAGAAAGAAGAAAGMEEPTFVVLDNADRLRVHSPEILAAFLRLAELVRHPVTVVLISSIVWEKFRGGTGCTEPFLLHFPAYTKEATLEIIARDCPADEDPAFFKQFVQLLWGVFNGPCRDLNELRHLVALLFPRYLEPIRKGEASREDGMFLYKKIAPHLKKQLSRLYLRETSSADWSAATGTSAGGGGGGAAAAAAAAAPTSSTMSGELELPYLSKYLLIAAYLASYNPASTDVRVFAKRAGKKRRKLRGPQKKTAAKVPQHLLGPKAFPLDRLLAIFYSIIETRVEASSEVYTQIASLVTLRLLAQASNADNLEAPKYKCLVALHDVQKVAATVQFELVKYVFESN